MRQQLIIKRYENKIKNRIPSKINTGSYLEHLTPETMKLLGSTKNKITKDKNGENVSHFEVTGVVLIHCHILLTIIVSKMQESYKHLFLINHLVNY